MIKLADMENSMIIVFVTCPPDKADNIAEILVGEKLAACANIVPVKSVYIWEEKLNRDNEALLVIKTMSNNYPILEKRIKEIHPYDVPEVVAIKAEAVEADYLVWVNRQTKLP